MIPSKSVSSKFLFLWLAIPSCLGAYSLSGCSKTCGNVSIPFPFGIGPDCYVNDWFSIDCIQSSNPLESPLPYLSKLKLRVHEISLQNQTVIIVTQVNSSSGHQNFTWNSSNLTGSPFYFSKDYNKLMFLGCGNAFLLFQKNQSMNVLSACVSTCHESMNDTHIHGCYGMNCCETSIPFYLSEYEINFTASGPKSSGSSNFAFLTDSYWHPENYSFPLPSSSKNFRVALTWTIKKSDLPDPDDCIPQNSSIQLESGQLIESWTCLCWPDQETYCSRDYPNNGRYPHSNKKNWKSVIVGVTTSVGVLFLVAASFMSYKLIKRNRIRKIKEKFFKRNGGLLLQKQLSTGDNVIEKTTIFTAVELEKATDNFNENRILGRGGQGTVYKGMLTDGRIVAIKRSKLVNGSQLEQFINEVVVLSQVVHKNVVKLLGCCLETEVPLLVYEFIVNGTLSEMIHNVIDREFLITWNVRLRIAAEVAGALAYLHSAVSIPIYHRDIKSTNILLDEKYTAKVSDFGTSRTVATDKTHITTLVKGTFGYLDPEYFQSSQFTEKSDVYSFGVVLVELLTGQKAVSWAAGTSEDGNLSLATRFLASMEENCLNKIVDAQVLYHENWEDINAVAKLAERCLNLNGKKRPTMKEVAFELERIRISKAHPSIPSNLQSLEFIEEESTLEFSDSISTYSTNCSTCRPISDTFPMLFYTF